MPKKGKIKDPSTVVARIVKLGSVSAVAKEMKGKVHITALRYHLRNDKEAYKKFKAKRIEIRRAKKAAKSKKAA